jgi:alanyl-tRNA synthetase
MGTHRIYYDDSFERNFEARVISCDPAPPFQGPSGAQAAWEVVLDRTAFYPTSGGQPHDVGLIGEARVLDVREAEEEIIHIVDRLIPAGPANGCVEWTRRFDHMQQHTGQHLLSAMFQERFGLPTVSFHLGAEISTIDLRGPQPSAEILEGAERAANQVIFESRAVTVRYGTAEQLAAIGVRKQVERAGILRAIEIASADLQPCGGTHVKHTGQIGVLLLRRVSKIRQDWRIEFVCGDRAVRFARTDFHLLQDLSERLGVAPESAASAIERALGERDTHFKGLRAIIQRLAQAEASASLSAADALPGGIRVVTKVIKDIHPDYLAALASELTKSEKTIALLARQECGHMIFAQHPSAERDMNVLLRQLLEKVPCKGGGSKDFVRARLADPSQAEHAVAAAKSLLA